MKNTCLRPRLTQRCQIDIKFVLNNQKHHFVAEFLGRAKLGKEKNEMYLSGNPIMVPS
jgi:hypothetical protein